MSCVADENARSQKNASVACTKPVVGIISATPASPPPMSTCIAMIQSRFVLIISTSGLQNGLITHGR